MFIRRKKKSEREPMAGLGDVVAKVIHAVTGIEPCDACKQRRAKLNRLFPFRKR